MTSSALEIRGSPANHVTVTDDALTVELADGRSIAGVLTWQRVDQPTAPNLQGRMLVELTMRDPVR